MRKVQAVNKWTDRRLGWCEWTGALQHQCDIRTNVCKWYSICDRLQLRCCRCSGGLTLHLSSKRSKSVFAHICTYISLPPFLSSPPGHISYSRFSMLLALWSYSLWLYLHIYQFVFHLISHLPTYLPPPMTLTLTPLPHPPCHIPYSRFFLWLAL